MEKTPKTKQKQLTLQNQHLPEVQKPINAGAAREASMKRYQSDKLTGTKYVSILATAGWLLLNKPNQTHIFTKKQSPSALHTRPSISQIN